MPWSEREIVSMPRIIRLPSFILMLIGIAPFAAAEVQTQPQQAAPAAPATAAAPGGRGPAIPGANDVLATIAAENQTDKITKGDVVSFMSHYPMPDEEDRESAYRQAVDSLVNTKLLMMFLARQKLKVPPEKVDEQLEQLKLQLKQEGQDIGSALLQSGTNIDAVRKEFENRIRWSEYVKEPRSGPAIFWSSSIPPPAQPKKRKPVKSWPRSRRKSRAAPSPLPSPPINTPTTPPTPEAQGAISISSRSRRAWSRNSPTSPSG
jgi:hypothetical protein